MVMCLSLGIHRMLATHPHLHLIQQYLWMGLDWSPVLGQTDCMHACFCSCWCPAFTDEARLHLMIEHNRWYSLTFLLYIYFNFIGKLFELFCCFYCTCWRTFINIYNFIKLYNFYCNWWHSMTEQNKFDSFFLLFFYIYCNFWVILKCFLVQFCE